MRLVCGKKSEKHVKERRRTCDGDSVECFESFTLQERGVSYDIVGWEYKNL